ncbi:MAG: hypothetical protein U0324_35925 [Polyangiales bacterium]
MSPRAAATAALALATLALAAPAAAQPREEARRLYQQGVAAFDARDFATALARFQQAYVQMQRPELLVNVAATFEQLGRPTDALETYRRYLALAPEAPDRPAIEARVARLAATPSAPPPAPPPPPPPSVVTRPPPSPPPATRAPAPPVWPWVLVGGGAAVAAAGVVLLALPGDPGRDRSIESERAYLDAVARRETFAVAGGVALGVGVAAAAAGVVGLALRPSPSRTALTLSGAALAGGGAVTVGGTF